MTSKRKAFESFEKTLNIDDVSLQPVKERREFMAAPGFGLDIDDASVSQRKS